LKEKAIKLIRFSIPKLIQLLTIFVYYTPLVLTELITSSSFRCFSASIIILPFLRFLILFSRGAPVAVLVPVVERIYPRPPLILWLAELMPFMVSFGNSEI